MPSRKTSKISRKNYKKTSKSPRKTSKTSGKLKLIKIAKSPKKEKKLRAYFSDGTHTDFGAKNYSDFTKHHDIERRSRYLARHKSREKWSSPKTAGSLSKYILWNKTSLKASIADYKRKFNL